MRNQRAMLELESILERCQYIHEDARGLTAEKLIMNRLPRQAIERNVGQLAVSASRIRNLEPTLYEELEPLNHAMIVGNQLLNGYGDDVDTLALWEFVSKTNDDLAVQIRALT